MTLFVTKIQWAFVYRRFLLQALRGHTRMGIITYRHFRSANPQRMDNARPPGTFPKPPGLTSLKLGVRSPPSRAGCISWVARATQHPRSAPPHTPAPPFSSSPRPLAPPRCPRSSRPRPSPSSRTAPPPGSPPPSRSSRRPALAIRPAHLRSRESCPPLPCRPWRGMRVERGHGPEPIASGLSGPFVTADQLGTHPADGRWMW